MRLACRIVLLLSLTCSVRSAGAGEPNVKRYLYVAAPGIRNYVEYGGHGLLVFDIDQGHRFVRRIATGGLDDKGRPINVKGICASARTGLIHISTIRSLMCIDMRTDKLLWEKRYEYGCDRMALSPDGRTIYQPSFENDHWYVLDARTGKELARLTPRSRAHNTVFGPDVIDVRTRQIVARLTDERGRAVGSEKLLEIDWQDGKPIAAGNQFGVGRVVRSQ